MLDKFFTKLFKIAYPERDIGVGKIDENFFLHEHDSTGCNCYLLKGQYSYDEVVELNELTFVNQWKYHCGFGFCEEIGPVAFIGVSNVHFCGSGYFKPNVQEYGMPKDQSEYYFKAYPEEDAKHIGNYTVYGFMGLEVVATKAPMDKIMYIYDSRYKHKRTNGRNKDKTIIEMDYKLFGTYSFYEARLLATDTTKDMEAFRGESNPIQFAIVDDDQYVGIINIGNVDNILQFRDVWEYGCKRPELQRIRFLSKEEAEQIKGFTLYIYLAPFNLRTKEYPIEKMDRTFDKRFQFQLPDGRDYRLI